jgi:hypothetical protein
MCQKLKFDTNFIEVLKQVPTILMLLCKFGKKEECVGGFTVACAFRSVNDQLKWALRVFMVVILIVIVRIMY